MRLFEIDASAAELMEYREEFAPEELDQLYQLVIDNEDIDGPGLTQLARDLEVDWPRGFNSLKLALIRMYGLVRGKSPDNMSPSPSIYGLVSSDMIAFVGEKGHDVTKHLEMAKIDAQEKIEQRERQKSKEEALKIMSEYWKSIKDSYSKEILKGIQQRRDEIIQMIMSGSTAQEAFGL